MESPPLPAKVFMPEKSKNNIQVLDKRKDENAEARHVKEEVAKVLEQAKSANSYIRDKLLLESGGGEMPVKDFVSKDSSQSQRKVTRRKQNSLNGVAIPNNPPGNWKALLPDQDKVTRWRTDRVRATMQQKRFRTTVHYCSILYCN